MDMEYVIDFLPHKIVGLPNKAYHLIKRDVHGNRIDSRSLICQVEKGGGETQYWIDGGHSMSSGTSATSIGSDWDQITEGVLQGKKFDDLISVPPEDVLGANGSKSTKAFREWRDSQTGIVCTEEQRWKFAKMYDNLLRNDASYKLLSAVTETQVSVFFQIDDHRLKVRPDACTPELWWDMKTTSSTWDKLFFSIRDYGYAEQEYLYVQGAMAIGMPHHRMPFVFCQTVPPYQCRVYHLPEPLVERAGRRVILTLELMALRRDTGSYWGSESTEINELDVPAWALKEEEAVEV